MRYIIAILLFTFPFFLEGQLVTSTNSAVNLVLNNFAGPGVTISNISYSGSLSAIGQFTATGTNLGINSGVILTTGTIFNNGNGPHGPNNVNNAGIDNFFGGDSQLSNIAGGNTYNAAILEFDFETCADSVQFKYVFGSEEYPEYVNTEYNDAFAFFISGPGFPPGGQNIAKLPNGNTVSINNIHSAGTNINGANFGAVNQQFYVNNNGGPTIQYDGFTTKLTAKTKVECNTVYHLKIAIADVGDGIYDSGIFLEANSFIGSTRLDLSYQLSLDVFNDNSILAESCASNTVTLTRPSCSANIPLTLNTTVSGTAIEGVDFSAIPATITFPAGLTTTSFTFNAFQDGITEGLETVNLAFSFIDNCGNQQEQDLALFIQDINPIEINITSGVIICPGEEIEIISNVTGGGGQYSYLWSTGETTASILVSPTSTQTYTVQVIDNCLTAPISQSYTLNVPIIPPLVLNETNDITTICPYVPALLESNASGGTAPYTYNWSSPSSPNLSSNSAYTAVPSQTTVYTILVTDYCGLTASEDIVYTITSPPLVLDMSPEIEICPGDSALISVSSSGGYGQHFYQWWHSGETTPSVWVKPGVTTSYTVSVSDECQTFTVEGTTRVIVVKPTADFTITSQTVFNNLPIQFQNLSQNASNYQWYFGDGNQSNIIHPQNTYNDPGQYYITLIATDDKGCIDSIQKLINIEEEWYIYIPNTFIPDGNRINDVFSASVIGINRLNINIFNRWGEVVFTSNEPRFIWDGTYKNLPVPDGTYTYSINLTTNSGREKKLNGHVNVLR